MKTTMTMVLAIAGLASAQAYTLENVKWGSGTASFYVDLGVWNNVAARELSEWDKYTGNTHLTTTNNATTNGSDSWVTDGRSSIVWSTAVGWTLPSNVLGATSLNAPGGILEESDIVLNPYFIWSDGGVGGMDIGWVLLHEIGHAIGLGHSADSGSVMWPYISLGTRELGADDIAGARFIYGPRTASVPDTGATLPLLALGLSVIAGMRRKQ